MRLVLAVALLLGIARLLLAVPTALGVAHQGGAVLLLTAVLLAWHDAGSRSPCPEAGIAARLWRSRLARASLSGVLPRAAVAATV